jgi:two-component system phosphate regulon sensor histidine kinase PhoR
MLLRHKKLLEMKNDFINHMSHEFKTPLAGISLGADMLMGQTGQMGPEQIQRVAGTIKKQSMRLSQEVNEVLQNALLEENIHKPHTLFNVADTLKAQLELLQPQLESKGAIVNTSFSSNKVLISGDENQWQKVFSNLIDNSLKFSKENPEITINVMAHGPKVKMEFADNGVGIAGKDLPRIFEKFFRSDYYRQSNIQGFGLGLNFVKTVVNAHKGSIKAESELNVGTKIIIELDAEA